ncbi:MAG: PP2C family protein-serine/threonine phosphatase [Trebonia sp.]
MAEDPAASPGGHPRISPLAVEGLRLSTGADLTEIAGMTLDAVVPGFADAAVVFAVEHLLRDGDPVSAGSGERESSGQVTARRMANRFADDRHDPAAFPPGEAVVLAAGSPYAQCVNDGKPVVFARPDGRTLDRAGPGGRAAFSRYASFLTVPMSTGGTAAGLIALARAPGRAAFGDSDITDIARLAAFAGVSIARVVTLTRHRSITSALQRGLLAAEPARPDHLDVAGRCLPAEGNLVGGDWYDIISLPGDRSGIVVGDVMGHGPEAAAIMAQLRAAAHALAQTDPEPAELLGHLNRLIMTLPGMPLATCAYAVIDPARHSCTLAEAGHLPPVLARPGGAIRTLHLPSGPSLGVGPADYGQARIKLPPGAVVAFYTDGLVETRTRSFHQGITALQAELTRADDPLDATCDRIISSLARYPEDDITLILARIPSASEGCGPDSGEGHVGA